MTDTTLKAVEAATGGTDLGAIEFMQAGMPVKVAKSTIVDASGNPISYGVLGVVGAGAAATAQRVHLADESLQGIRAASTLGITAAGANDAAVTATLPAAGAGLFHYIDSIEIVLYNSAARVGASTPVVVTSTNLPGGLAWLFPTAGEIGTIERQTRAGTRLFRASAANTATTIVCPAVTGVRWGVNVMYSVGP